TGTVSWTSDGAGTFSAASCTLDATGKCSVSYTPTALGTGTHKITGSYGGDPKHATSSGSFNEAVATRTSGPSVDCVPPSVPGHVRGRGHARDELRHLQRRRHHTHHRHHRRLRASLGPRGRLHHLHGDGARHA